MNKYKLALWRLSLIFVMPVVFPVILFMAVFDELKGAFRMIGLEWRQEWNALVRNWKQGI